ncbi:MAG: FHA domain-containing protein [Spirochaetia bacterium]|nr:FHA domain-containing protein [Spirochaetia bacterium]
MMTLSCKYCGQEISVEEGSVSTCPNCLSKIDSASTQIKEPVRSENQNAVPSGFSLIFQKDGTEISFKHAEKMVLGRNGLGQEFFSKIPQISRSHLVIQFQGNQYTVTDLNSSNGTFLGVEKVDCRKNPGQALRDGELLYMGREPFLVKLNFIDQNMPGQSGQVIRVNMQSISANIPQPEKSSAAVLSSETEKKQIVYTCTNCYNYQSETKEFTCPLCNTYNS